MRVAIEIVKARGHVNITAKHETTIEVIRDDYLTPQGDCIIGVNANKASSDLSEDFKETLKNNDTVLIVVLLSRSTYDYLIARGSSSLKLTDRRKIIIRKSDYIDDATLAIKSNKAAKDLSRELVRELVDGAQLYVVLIAIRLGM